MSDVPKRVEEAFYSGKRTNEIPFAINDCVEVVVGPQAGRAGAVIPIESTHPEVTLRVELGEDGKDVVVSIAALATTDSTLKSLLLRVTE